MTEAEDLHIRKGDTLKLRTDTTRPYVVIWTDGAGDFFTVFGIPEGGNPAYTQPLFPDEIEAVLVERRASPPVHHGAA